MFKLSRLVDYDSGSGNQTRDQGTIKVFVNLFNYVDVIDIYFDLWIVVWLNLFHF